MAGGLPTFKGPSAWRASAVAAVPRPMAITPPKFFSAAEAEAALARAAAQIADKKSKQTAAARDAKFLAFCSALQLNPSTYEAWAKFLLQFMRDNEGHTASLSGVASNLRTQARECGRPPLSPLDEYRLRELISDQMRHDSTGVKRAAPLRFALLAAIVARMDLTVLVQLQQATQMLLAVTALLRGGELPHLRARDFLFVEALRMVRITIPGPTKTGKTGAGVPVEVADTTNALSAVKMLTRLWKARGLATRPSEFVFCNIRAGVLLPTEPSPEDAFRKLVKTAVMTVGENPKQYGGHSARAGGATDLFAANVAYPVIKKYGRWVTDTALIYYRCELSVAQAAAAAWGAGADRV